MMNNLADAPGYPLSEDAEALRLLLFEYANEYLAFDFAYQFCLFYERGTSKRADGLVISEDYIRTIVHFLKYKDVSPHALFLIFKSLFHP